MKVNKAAFDSALGKLLKAAPLPLAKIPRKRKPAPRKRARATR